MPGAILRIAFFLFPVFCFGQEDTISVFKIPEKKFDLGAFVSPDYTSSQFKEYPWHDEQHNTFDYRAADSLQDLVSSSMSFSAGVDFLYYFKKNMGLKTGIWCAARAYKYSGFIYQNGIILGLWSFRFQEQRKDRQTFLEVPLSFNYSWAKNDSAKFRLDAFGGVIGAMNCTSFIIQTVRFNNTSNYMSSSESDYVQGEVKSFKRLYAGCVFGAQFHYRFNAKVSCFVSPVFKYFFLTGFHKEFIPIGYSGFERNSSIGLNIGINYTFWK